jgi:polysaccharide deacetylase family protein (PEP-CTERM system associated)
MALDPTPTPNVFTIDLEEWFNFEFGGFGAPRSEWGGLESRVVPVTEQLLDILEETNTRATFFVLGWVAERQPRLIRRIAEAGHEIGSHSYAHREIRTLDAASFAQDLRRAKATIENASGQVVQSFRAPMFSLTPDMGWAFDVLAEEGIRFDSSLFPGRRLGGGAHQAPLAPHVIDTASGELLEFPISMANVGGVRIPMFGGGYFRLFPARVVITAAKLIGARSRPVMFYVHPHDLDPGQPRVVEGWLPSFRRYYGLDRTARKLHRLLEAVPFTRLDWACERGSFARVP